MMLPKPQQQRALLGSKRTSGCASSPVCMLMAVILVSAALFESFSAQRSIALEMFDPSNTFFQRRTAPETVPEYFNQVGFRKNAGFCRAQGCTEETKVREAWSLPETLSALKEADKEQTNRWVEVRVPRQPGLSYMMLTRDASRDKYISGKLQQGSHLHPDIRDTITTQLQQFQEQYHGEDAVFIDVGANIGMFTSLALALGATVISFEPVRENLGVLMNTVQENGWQRRHWLYHNAVHFEPLRVFMRPTNSDINLFNGAIFDSQCATTTTTSSVMDDDNDDGLQYGVDYMESVTLDRVMLKHHSNIDRVAVMKVDVETFEPQVVNGAMAFLCNRIVHNIIMEVQYILKDPDTEDTICNTPQMITTLAKMGYTISDMKERKTFQAHEWRQLPGDVLFTLQDTSMTPRERLMLNYYPTENPCFEWRVPESFDEPEEEEEEEESMAESFEEDS